MVGALVVRVHKPGNRLQAGNRTVGGVGGDNLDQRRARRAGDLGLHLPVQRVLGRDRRGLLGKDEPGLIGAFGFDAAEGRHRGPDHDGVHARDRREECDEADEHHPSRHLPRGTSVSADRIACRRLHSQGPRKWSTALARCPVCASVIRNVSGIEAAGGSDEYVLTRARNSWL